jgi:predicted  nucleic acid-binding Zn-ribbon protein
MFDVAETPACRLVGSELSQKAPIISEADAAAPTGARPALATNADMENFATDKIGDLQGSPKTCNLKYSTAKDLHTSGPIVTSSDKKWQWRSAQIICVLLVFPYFLLAGAFVVVTQEFDAASLLVAFWSASWQHELAWIVIMLVPLIMLPPVLFLCNLIMEWGATPNELPLQSGLGSAWQQTEKPRTTSGKNQVGTRQPACIEGEGAVSATLKLLLTQLWQNRNEINELRSCLSSVRDRQLGLKEAPYPDVKTIPPIKQFFAEFDNYIRGIERTFVEAAGESQIQRLKDRLSRLRGLVGRCQKRFDDIEQLSKEFASLKDDYFELHERLAPYLSAAEGIESGIKDLSAASEMLAADMDSLMPNLRGDLAAGAQTIANDQKKLDASIKSLSERLGKLAKLRRDIEANVAPYVRPTPAQIPAARARPRLVSSA